MATLNTQTVRARVTVGGLSVYTPDVVSFNVTRSRKQMCANFSASLKVGHASLTAVNGSTVTIAAGSDGVLITIFTGVVEKASINPIRSDASKVMLNISGRDVLMRLEGKNITRRATDTGLPLFATVNSITRHDVQKMQKFATRINSNTQKVIPELGDFPNVTIPEAFRSVPPINKSRSDKTIGVLSVEKTNVGG